MTLNSIIPTKNRIMRTLRTLLLIVMTCSLSSYAHAQLHYTFNCRDYVSTDDNRAPQSKFAYDDEANTFTINGNTGTNNIAFEMNDAIGGKYYITNEEEWFVVEGTNLRAGNASDAAIWWFNGFNNNGSVCPVEHIVDNGDTKLFVWNTRTNSLLNPNMNFANPRIVISNNGSGFIHAMGLTAASGTKAIINNINYYSSYTAAVRYPNLLPTLGYTAESLTAEVKAKVAEAVAEAEDKNPVAESTLATLIAKVKTQMEALGATDYVAAVEILLQLRESTEQYDTLHPTVSYSTTTDGIVARYNEQYIRITFHSDDVVRVYKTYGTDHTKKRSISITQEPMQAPEFTVSEEGSIVMLTGQSLKVAYDMYKSTVSVIRLADGEVMIAEKAASTFTPRKDGPHDSYTVTGHFLLDDDEYIFGMGQIQDGNLNLRGQAYHLEIASLKVVIPYFQSSKNYAFFWDNYSPTEFLDGAEGMQFSSTGTEVDYYIIVGNTPSEVLSLERQLTGKSPMPALWNFGLYQSRQRYMSAQEVMEVVQKYRELQVPLDCVVQDWQYWGDNAHWNAMEFLNPTYANYQEMIDYVHANNAKIMISIWSNFGPSTKPFKEMQAKGHLMTGDSYPFGSGVRPYDPWSSEARDIYWRYLYEGIASKGIDAYWMDSTEPDYAPLNGDADFNFLTGWGKTWRSMRNTFPLAAVSGVHDHHRAVEKDGNTTLTGKRVSILTRSAFLGQQRYGANTWSSDIVANWSTLANQIPAALNFSACGIPYWNSDTGAFFGGNTGDAGWRRLFMRWVQFSCFCPMMRIHGDGNWREIYQFGSAHDGVGDYDQFAKYIKLRYRLLPYLYSTAWQVSKHDQTFMQALPLAFADDRDGYDVKDEYMFGHSFLVAPIIQDAATSREVYLPKGALWTDFWTGQLLEGGQHVTKTAPVDIIPLYVRAGSIIPWGPDVQYATEKPWDDMEVRVYPGADGTFTLYEDENDNYNYENGQYTEIPFTWNDATNTLTIGARTGSFEGMLTKRTFRLVKVSTRRGTGDAHTEHISYTVTYDGTEQQVVLDGDDQPVTLTDITNHYITNPSFEADGRTSTKVNPKGWTVVSPTAWWGVNRGGGSGDPIATDGEYIFGVWDSSNTITSKISQSVTLPNGRYLLTVDIHAPNRGTSSIRLGKQRLFAGDSTAYMRNQIMVVGTDDMAPLQTIGLTFTISNEHATLPIGVATDGAPVDTWFKIDNFRLYAIGDYDVPDGIVVPHTPRAPGIAYDLQGRRLNRLSTQQRGIAIIDGKLVIER